MEIPNPNYIIPSPTLDRDTLADWNTLQGLIAAWPADVATITTHDLAQAFVATLSADEIDMIQGDKGSIGNYVEWVLAEAWREV